MEIKKTDSITQTNLPSKVKEKEVITLLEVNSQGEVSASTTSRVELAESARVQREAAISKSLDLSSYIRNESLLNKYKINPDEVQVVSKSGHLTTEKLNEILEKKELFLTKLLQAHEHALKNKKLQGSKFSNRQYASNLEFELTTGNKVELTKHLKHCQWILWIACRVM